MARLETSRKALSTLSTTGRKYLESTHGARLASPGIEHYPGEKRRGPGRTLVLAAVLVLALVGAMLWLVSSGR
jgi:hypothetical protein